MPSQESARPTNPTQVLFVVGAGTFLTAMAGSMVNLALPDLGRDLSVSVEESRWVVQAFLLAVGVLLPVAGRLSDMFSHRRVYLVGFVLFGAASLACGLSANLTQLIVMRALHGVGGAMIMATGPALLTTSFAPRSRGKALGMQATATYVGLTIGPPVGGWIVNELSWRWTFYFFVPVSAVILALGFFFLPRIRDTRRMEFDWAGATALVLGLPLLLLAISEGQQWGAASPWTWSTAAAGLAGMVVFVALQRGRPVKLMDLSLFRSRIFSGSVVAALANYIALFSPILLLPFYLIEGLGLDPKTAGMVISACPLVMALVASPSGWLSDRIGSRGLKTAGILILSGGLFGLSTLGSASAPWQVAAWWAVIGLGIGIFISPNSSALMGAAPRQQQGVAGGLLAEARVLGMLLGVTLATAVFHAGGGDTGKSWEPNDFEAMHLAFLVTGFVALAGAAAASLKEPKVD